MHRLISSFTLNIFFIFIGMVLALNVFAESYPKIINFQHILENEDIVLGEIQAIYQDSDGFIWLGGETSLIRFDGYEFKAIEFYHDKPSQKKQVKSIAHIFEDNLGSIWVGMRDGLKIYDKRSGRLTLISEAVDVIEPVSDADVRFIAQSSTGHVVAASYNGIYIIDPITFHYEHITKNSGTGLSHNRTHSLYFDTQNNLWIGTEAGLDKMDWTTKKIINYKPYASAPDSITRFRSF